MSMTDYETAARLITANPVKVDLAPQPEDRVARAAQALGIEFPPTFRRFLTEFGAGGVGSETIYGVCSDDIDQAGVPQTVKLTREFRADGWLTDAMVVVGDLGDGTFFVLDVAGLGPAEEGPVIAVTPGAIDEPREVVASDFGAFLLEQTEFGLED